jgi:hypothetical protein
MRKSLSIILMWMNIGLALTATNPLSHHPFDPIDAPMATCSPTTTITPIPSTTACHQPTTTPALTLPSTLPNIPPSSTSSLPLAPPDNEGKGLSIMEMCIYAVGITLMLMLVFPFLSEFIMQTAYKLLVPLLTWLRIGGGITLFITLVGHYLKHHLLNRMHSNLLPKLGNLSKSFAGITTDNNLLWFAIINIIFNASTVAYVYWCFKKSVNSGGRRTSLTTVRGLPNGPSKRRGIGYESASNCRFTRR